MRKRSVHLPIISKQYRSPKPRTIFVRSFRLFSGITNVETMRNDRTGLYYHYRHQSPETNLAKGFVSKKDRKHFGKRRK